MAASSHSFEIEMDSDDSFGPVDDRQPGEDLQYIQRMLGQDMPPAEPGPLMMRAQPRAWHCEACDCWVNRAHSDGAKDAWDVHIDGIRHTRSVLSLRETGRRGTVVSVFEPLPAMKGQGLRERWRGDEEEIARSEEFYRLRSTVLQQLVHHTGTGSRYHTLAERFAIERLDCAAAILEERRFPRRFFRQRSVNRWLGGSLEFGADAAMLVALAHALQKGRLPVHTLTVDVLTAHESDFAADLAGLVLLIRALRCGQVARLTLCFSSWTGGWPFSALQPLGLALAEECSRRCLPLRRLCFSFPMVASDLVQGVGDYVCPEEVVAAASASATRARLAVLMALHSRSRARRAQRKTLADLPPDLLQLILDRAAPLPPLTVEIEARAPG